MNRSRHSLVALVVCVLAVVVTLAGLGTATYAAHKVRGNALIKKHSLSANRLKTDTVTGRQVDESTLATVPHATLADQMPASTLQTVTLANPWTAGPDRPLGFRKDPAGIVHLQGQVGVAGIATAHMFDLPAGARPAGPAYFAVSTGTNHDTPGIVVIRPNGAVSITAGDGHNIDLDSISFYAEG